MAPLASSPFFSLIFVFFLGFSHLNEMVSAFDNDRSDNIAAYWGQDGAGHQQRLSYYCNDDSVDAIPLAFLYIFRGKGGFPAIDFSNICGAGGNTFPGTEVADCSFLEDDIKRCQAKGKIVTLSLGGATSQVGFSSDSEATAFGQLLWDMFLGGSGIIRPLGSAILDGVDLDIEKGSSAHYAAMVNKIRSLAKGAKKRYYVTAAPQCPYPDVYIGGALNDAPFDAVYVQFYNNYCETSRPQDFNFDTWDHWAKTQSANPDVKVYLGAPASPQAAGNGYVDADTLARVAKDAQNKYSSFGGVMLWDMDSAYTNGHYHVSVKNALSPGGAAHVGPGSSKPGSEPTADPWLQEPAPSTSRTAAPTPIALTLGDPRATARVKRPSFTLTQRDEAKALEAAVPPAEQRPTKNSRFFRF